MANALNNPIFQDADKARDWLEAHLWEEGPICPGCGTIGSATALTTRTGWYQCNESGCRKQFTVTVSYKSTWFMMHRLREAMRDGKFSSPLGGEGKTVEADETFVGGKEKNKHRSKRAKSRLGGSWGKETVFSLVERGGSVKSMHVTSVTAATLRPILVAQVDRKSVLMTDDAGQYRYMGREFLRHESVNHGIEEYVRGEAHTNTIEGYFSILKRGIVGTYHHVSQQHLKRYLAEFDFRYNERAKLGVTDTERAEKALKGIVGKRLTYRRTNEAANA
jgi:transposase-like protein